MTLDEFMFLTEAVKKGTEWIVICPLKDGTTGRLFIENVKTEFEAKEEAFTYLNDLINKKNA